MGPGGYRHLYQLRMCVGAEVRVQVLRTGETRKSHGSSQDRKRVERYPKKRREDPRVRTWGERHGETDKRPDAGGQEGDRGETSKEGLRDRTAAALSSF